MSVSAPLARLRFVCPTCRAPVVLSGDEYTCATCAISYPVVTGIPDFRVAPDPWIGFEDDRAKALRLEAMTAGKTFEDMVRAYWSITPETPRSLAQHFISHVLGAEARTKEWLGRLGIAGASNSAPWLDIGCGTADLAVAAPHVNVVGIDVAFRWLVVARRRLEERGLEPLLVCCNAEALPFPDATFSRALSLGTFEHVEDMDIVLRETRRVLVPGGTLNVRTGNRRSLLRNRADFRFYWPRSAGELARGLDRAGFRQRAVGAGAIFEAEAAKFPRALRKLLSVYDTVRRVPLLRGPATWWTPVLEASAVAP